jgi:hypothetical protein
MPAAEPAFGMSLQEMTAVRLERLKNHEQFSG